MTRGATTARGLDRLVNFSDATVAIALTLLVLPLVELPGDGRDAAAVLADGGSELLGFGVSFAVVGRLWVAHHAVFEDVRAYDGTLLALGFVWLGGIVLVPFATALLTAADDGPDALADVLYLATLVLTCLALMGVQARLRRRPALVRPGAVVDTTGGLVAVGLLVVALVLAALVPAVGMLWVLLLALSGPVGRVVRSRTAAGRAAEEGHGRDDGVPGDEAREPAGPA
ncbi:TMEM175 family protein [Cellulomonas sp. NPDC057328]|uniref:TMEM175 family protein n=1 Tax=Cellulomonas sp. NPDC057328 TaxID=3346101 RepID=UPI00362B8E4B